MFYRKCPMKRVGTERENSGEKKKGEEEREKKKCMRRAEKIIIKEGILWLEKCKEISPCCLRTISSIPTICNPTTRTMLVP